MFDGEGSETSLEINRQCPKCNRKGNVYYTGSEVMHGNPFTGASDTKVNHYYRCKGCGHRFVRYA